MDKTILHKNIYQILRGVLRPYLWVKYRFKTDNVPKIDEPYILLSNHTTEEDMFFTGVASRQHMYFVCGEHLLRNKLYGRLLRTLADPLPVPKGGTAINSVREIMKRTKDGHNICMFPEGKRSFHGETIPSPVSLGKLVKMTGCALVTYRIEGGYFTYPRWARGHHRKGHVEGNVVGVYSSSQIKGMSASEITEIINRDTYENAYETQRIKRLTYKGKDLAKGMEHVLFICPRCRTMDSIQTKGDRFFCSECGMNGIYDEYGFLKGDDLPFDDVHSWMRWIEPEYDTFVIKHEADEILFTEEDVLLYQMLDDYQNKDIERGTLKVSRDRMVFGSSGKEFIFDEIPYLSILYGNILLFTYNGNYYGLTGDAFRAWKCARLWHLVKGDVNDRTKEM